MKNWLFILLFSLGLSVFGQTYYRDETKITRNEKQTKKYSRELYKKIKRGESFRRMMIYSENIEALMLNSGVATISKPFETKVDIEIARALLKTKVYATSKPFKIAKEKCFALVNVLKKDRSVITYQMIILYYK